jgi:hypothetical protein
MRVALLAIAACSVAAALLFARPHATPGPPMRDFEAYYAAGSVWNAGGDPYSQTIWNAERKLDGVDSRRYEALPFVGPPALLPFFGVIARLPFAAANIVWRAALISAMALLALVTLRLCGQPARPWTCLAFALAALGFGPLTSALALGQIALPAFLFAALALSVRPLSILAWLQPNVAFALFGQLFEKRTAVTYAGGAAVFASLCAAALGIPGIAHYAAVLHAHAQAERFSAIQITPAAIAYGFGAPPGASAAFGTLIAAAAVVWWLALMRFCSGALERFCATAALLPLASPFFHEHDLLVLFVPALVFSLRVPNGLSMTAAYGASFAATDWLGLAQRPGGTLQTVLLIGSFTCAIVALQKRPTPAMLVLPLGAIACIAAAAAFASGHPAPVWPDAMHALPADVQAQAIAHAWGAQQRATGLLTPQPVWAALRALSLFGCVLTAAAITASLRDPAGSRRSSPAPA